MTAERENVDMARAIAVEGVTERAIRGAMLLMVRGGMVTLHKAGVGNPLSVMRGIVQHTGEDLAMLLKEFRRDNG